MTEAKSAQQTLEGRIVQNRHSRFMEWMEQLPENERRLVETGMAHSDLIWADRYSRMMTDVVKISALTAKPPTSFFKSS